MSRALAAALVGLVAAGAAHGAGETRPEPTRLQVVAREFGFALSRTAVRPGPIVIELVNAGEDDHDLAIRRRAETAVTRRIRTVRPGRLRSLETRLGPSRYVLWCTLADHRARGMRATLVVRP